MDVKQLSNEDLLNTFEYSASCRVYALDENEWKVHHENAIIAYAELIRRMEPSPIKCEWTYQDDEGYYETKCGKSFYFNFDGYLDMEDEGKLQDDFKWCPYCGKAIKPVYLPEEEE